MTKADLIKEVAEKTESQKKDVELTLEAILSGITKLVKENQKLDLRGFGKFLTKVRKARVGRNPKTGASVNIAEKTVVSFKPSKEFLEGE
jgi:integration host factor subunit beta